MDSSSENNSIRFLLFVLFWPLIIYPLTEWWVVVYEGLRIRIIEALYWSYFYRSYTSCTLSLLLAPEVFDGPSKCIRFVKKESDFSSKHKKKLVDDVMHGKHIGHIVLHKKCDEFGEYYHELFDGCSRLIALNDYRHDRFSWNHKRFSELTDEQRAVFRDYKMPILHIIGNE